MQAPPVFLHVGMMKTGTTYLQRTLRGATEAVEAQGLRQVPHNQIVAYRLARAIRGGPGETSEDGHRHLERLHRQVHADPPMPALLSVETLATSSPAAIERLCTTLTDREVHVVVTVRDVARTLPSAWQQSIRGGHTWTLTEYLDSVTTGEGRGAAHFRRGYDLETVLGRWSAAAPPERTHVVAVPAAGQDRDLLLHRFCGVVGLDADRLPRPTARANEQLGPVETEVLRRLNEVLPPDLMTVQRYGNLMKRYLALQVLAPRSTSRTAMPERYRQWCEQHATATVRAIADTGVHLVGEPGDLQPDPQAYGADPADLPEAEINAALLDTLRQVLLDHAAGTLADVTVPPPRDVDGLADPIGWARGRGADNESTTDGDSDDGDDA